VGPHPAVAQIRLGVRRGLAGLSRGELVLAACSGGADSLALIELVEALEEALATYSAGFHIDDEDLEGLLSVRDAVNYVADKLQVT